MIIVAVIIAIFIVVLIVFIINIIVIFLVIIIMVAFRGTHIHQRRMDEGMANIRTCIPNIGDEQVEAWCEDFLNYVQQFWLDGQFPRYNFILITFKATFLQPGLSGTTGTGWKITMPPTTSAREKITV